jgi:hypothetical protein
VPPAGGCRSGADLPNPARRPGLTGGSIGSCRRHVAAVTGDPGRFVYRDLATVTWLPGKDPFRVTLHRAGRIGASDRAGAGAVTCFIACFIACFVAVTCFVTYGLR